MKKVLLLLFSSGCLFGQDIHFSQYNFSSLQLNPANTAVSKDLIATLQHKEQWRSANAFRTSAACFEFKFNQKRWTRIQRMTSTFKKKLIKGLAMGLQGFTDKAGDGGIRQTKFNLSLAYHVLLDPNNTLSAGLLGSFTQRSISPDPLRWNNQYVSGVYDPNQLSGENFSNSNYFYPDFGMGVLWSYGDAARYMTSNDQKHISVGLSLDHINRPVYSFLGTDERLYRRFTGTVNTLFGIPNSPYSLAPSLLYMQQGSVREITAGMLVKYRFREESKYTGNIKGAAISLGCFYRNKDAVIPMLLLEMDSYSLGLSYDTNISGLTAVTKGRGGFEISLRFSTPSPFLYQNVKSRI